MGKKMTDLQDIRHRLPRLFLRHRYDRSQEIGKKFLAWTPETGPCPISINDPVWFRRLCGLFEIQAALEIVLAKCNAPTKMRYGPNGSYDAHHVCRICDSRGEKLNGMRLEDHSPDCLWRKAKEAENGRK